LIDICYEFSDFDTKPAPAPTVSGQIDQLKQLIRMSSEKNQSLMAQAQKSASESAGYVQHISILTQEIDACRRKLHDQRMHSIKVEQQLTEAVGTEALLKEEIDSLKLLCQRFDRQVSELKGQPGTYQDPGDVALTSSPVDARMIETLERALIEKSSAMLDLERVSKEKEEQLEAQIGTLVKNQNIQSPAQHAEIQTDGKFLCERPDASCQTVKSPVGHVEIQTSWAIFRNSVDVSSQTDSERPTCLADMNGPDDELPHLNQDGESANAKSYQDLQQADDSLENMWLTLQEDSTKCKLAVAELFTSLNLNLHQIELMSVVECLETVKFAIQVGKRLKSVVDEPVNSVSAGKSDQDAWGEFEFDDFTHHQEEQSLSLENAGKPVDLLGYSRLFI